MQQKISSEFEPSIKILRRIIELLLEQDHIGRTSLSLNANVNYTRLSISLAWLENRGLIEEISEDGRNNIRLTSKGREFAKILQGNSK